MFGRSRFCWVFSIAVVLLGAAFGPIRAQDGEYRLDLDFGYRWKAGFKGSEDLYRSQIDLGEGPKLFAGTIFYAPSADEARYFDRLELKMNSWGGEPYNTAHLNVAKNGVYELNFFYQNVSYFNSIPSFANPEFAQGNLQSLHRQDSSLTTTGFELSLRPGKTIAPFVAYQRTSRQGPVRTTFLADGDDFQLNSDLDVTADDLRGGVVFNLNRMSFRLEQGARWFRDDTTYASTGLQQGRVRLGEQLLLDGYNGSNRHRASAMPYSTAIAEARPLDSLFLSGRLTYSMSDRDTDFLENMTGNFFSFPLLRAFYSGLENETTGRAKSPNIYADLGVQWSPARWLRVTERFRTHRYHVSGSALQSLAFANVDPLLGSRITERLEMEMPLSFFLARNLDIQELTGEIFPDSRFSIRGGHRYLKRELELNEDFSYERNVLLLGGAYRFSTRNRIAVDYELGRTDQPIVRTDAVDFHRLKIHGKAAPLENLEVSGRVSLFDNESDLVDFNSENRLFSIQVQYAPISRISFSGQWERTEIDTDIPYIVPQSFRTERFFYRELGNYGNVYLNVLLIQNARLSLGYSVWGSSGSFPVNYHQPLAKLEVPLGERLVAYGQWNYYDYNEKLSLYPQDYRTHLAILGFRVSMGN